MANIRTDVNYTIVDGAEIIFKAPCDSCTVTGLKVYYPNSDGIIVNEVFVFKDAHGNDLTDLDTFKANAMVKVILNTTDHTAYIQNADTNAYLEGRFKTLEDGTIPLGDAAKLGGKDASEYLLADGSKAVTGNFTVKKVSGACNANVGNDKADIQLRVNSDGSMGVYDATHAKWLTKVDANGVSSVDVASSTLTDRLKTNRIDATDGKTLIQYDAERNTIGAYTLPTRIRSSSETNLTHYISANKEYVILDSGNVGSYALPISGGTVQGNIALDRGTAAASVRVMRTAQDGTKGFVQFWNGTSALQVNLAVFDESNNERASLAIDDSTMRYRGADKVVHNVLHTGNSTKVLVSQTPLTAEGSIRVW